MRIVMELWKGRLFGWYIEEDSVEPVSSSRTIRTNAVILHLES